MFGPVQTRTYPNGLHNSAHASTSAAYPYSTRRAAEGHTHSASHSGSPAYSRARPRANTSAAGPRFDVSHSGLRASGSRQHSNHAAYKADASVSSHSASSTRPRSRSQSQSQTRSRSSEERAKMYSWIPYGPPASQHHASGGDGPVVPVLTPELLEYFRQREEAERQRSSASYGAGLYAPARADSASVGYLYGRDAERPYFGRPPEEGPPFTYPYAQPPIVPPPEVFGGYAGPSGPSYPMPPPASYARGIFPPPRPPSPASHYPFANYGRPAGNAGQGSGRRSSNAQDESPPPPYTGVAASQADSTISDPLIHPALGWWPDQRRPALYWDLSSHSRPRYTKREFDAKEMTASPFTPPLSRMRLVLDPRAQWAYDIDAPRGEHFISLISLLKDIANIMHTPNMVPHSFWVRASPSKKEAVLGAMLRRTGRALPVQPPHRRPKTRGQIMEEAAVEGAPSGFTNLLVVDLLCDNVMFAGMEFHKEPDEWVLRTTRRYS